MLIGELWQLCGGVLRASRRIVGLCAERMLTIDGMGVPTEGYGQLNPRCRYLVDILTVR